MPHEFVGQKVIGNFCPRCRLDTPWNWIPDSLAEYCQPCGFVRILTGRHNEEGQCVYDAGATMQEWLEDVYGKTTKELE